MNNTLVLFPEPSYFSTTDSTYAVPTLMARHREHAQKEYARLCSSKQNGIAVGKNPGGAIQVMWDMFTHSGLQAAEHAVLERGAFISDFSYFATHYPAFAEQYLFNSSAVPAQKGVIGTLVDAYWQCARVLFVPEHTTLELPIVLDTILAQSGQLVIEKIVVILGSNSCATIDDRLVTKESTYAHIRSIDCFVGAGAQLNLVQEQDCSSAGTEFSHIRLHCQQKSNVHVALFSTGSAINKQLIDMFLLGHNATAKVTGATVLNENKQHNLTIRQEHYAPNTTSTVRIKNLVTDAACSVYNGTIFIAPGADGTKASQHTQALVLSNKAHAWAQPELEVLTNDVQCAHGSAVGQLDEMHLFYLQSRGLSRIQAQRLLIESFIADTLDIQAYYARKEYLIKKTLDAIFPGEVHV